MPLIGTRGAASAQGFGEFAQSAAPNYIEDVFSTWLYTGNGSTQTITNGIDLAGEGGLVWIKDRNSGAKGHALFDTARGVNKKLQSQSTAAEFSSPNQLTAFNADGFALGSETDPNGSGTTYVSWTFREQSKFFDVVTYTGTGSARTIAHNLGSVPGCIIVKQISANGQGWAVYHRSESNGRSIFLNDTAASFLASGYWNTTTPTSTEFTLGSAAAVNESGQTYIAYLFAHDSGGFGLTGTDNVISCGSYTGNGSATGPLVTLGYEPQWVIVKQSSAAGQWWNMIDVMRGFDVSTGAQTLGANASDAEYTNAGFGSGTPIMSPTATGFQVRSAQSATNASGATYIYIAIRRGPMKVPTDATKVFSPISRQGTGANATISGLGFPPDLAIIKPRPDIDGSFAFDKLRGATKYITTSSTAAETTDTSSLTAFNQTGISIGTGANLNVNSISNTYINWMFGRAPGFFDEVCYTGTSGIMNVSHNLAAVPELMIFKNRSAARRWPVYTQPTGNTQALVLNVSDAVNSTGNNYFNSTSPTSTVFTVDGGFADIGNSGNNYVAYLFATCPGVSKVGSYTGNGTTQAIACGFTGGARFVLIKRTDSTGDWYVYDTARGMTVLTDPYLRLNSNAAETATLGSVTTTAGGFTVNAAILAAINTNAATYIFLAIA
jgi:hypothetical protein